MPFVRAKGSIEMPITLTITRQDNGNWDVNGPIDNREFCHCALGMALDTLRNHWAAKASGAPSIQAPSLADLNAVARKM